jgi:hypothetical protein
LNFDEPTLFIPELEVDRPVFIVIARTQVIVSASDHLRIELANEL